jgi:hypothetical protein
MTTPMQTWSTIPGSYSRAALLVVIALAAPAAAFAQANVNYQAVNAFMFDRPSAARWMALADATIGMDDDGSAALSNPATLRLLVRGEIAVDSEFPSAFTPMISGGQIVRPALFGLPVVPASLQFTDQRIVSPPSGFAVSHIRFAYPTSRFTIAAFIRNSERDTRIDELDEFQTANPTQYNVSRAVFGGQVEGPVNPVNVSVGEYGGGASISVTRRLSVGAAVVFGVVDGSADIGGLAVDRVGRGVAERFAAVSNRETSVGYNVGVSFSPTSRVHLGVSHHQGNSSTWTITRDAAGLAGPLPQQARTARMQTPDWSGAGVGLRITETWRVLADVRIVRYSQTRDGLVALFLGVPDQFRVNDASELRVGTEYVVPFATSSIAVRAGLWRDPAHGLEYVGSDPAGGALLREVFTDRIGNRTHVTGGAGLSVGHFELSAAIDVADRYRTAAASAAFRFK